MRRKVTCFDFFFLQDLGENLDPSLNPILGKNTVQRGNQAVIVIGETEIEYNSNFRLYMTTPLANPHFLPEVCIKVTVINFTVTLEGLQDQLLSRVVQKERPKLEESRRELLQGLVTDRSKLRELEDRSLSLLHSSRGNTGKFSRIIAVFRPKSAEKKNWRIYHCPCFIHHNVTYQTVCSTLFIHVIAEFDRCCPTAIITRSVQKRLRNLHPAPSLSQCF